MKIAIASDDQNKISPHLGRTKGFVIVDIEKGKERRRTYRNNNFSVYSKGSRDNVPEPGRHAPIIAALKDCQVLVSHGMGRRIINDLKISKVDTYLTKEENVTKAIDLFIEGKLDNNPELGCSHD